MSAAPVPCARAASSTTTSSIRTSQVTVDRGKRANVGNACTPEK